MDEDRPGTASAEPRGADDDSDHVDWEAAGEKVLTHAREAGSGLLELLAISAERAKLELGTAVRRAGARLWIGIVGATLTVLAGWLVMTGLAEGLAVATGRAPWLGKLLAGGLVIIGIGAGFFARRTIRRRRNLARLRAAFERDDDGGTSS